MSCFPGKGQLPARQSCGSKCKAKLLIIIIFIISSLSAIRSAAAEPVCLFVMTEWITECTDLSGRQIKDIVFIYSRAPAAFTRVEALKAGK